MSSRALSRSFVNVCAGFPWRDGRSHEFTTETGAVRYHCDRLRIERNPPSGLRWGSTLPGHLCTCLPGPASLPSSATPRTTGTILRALFLRSTLALECMGSLSPAVAASCP
jgi:hypothetical protein